jgi:hypothetical protein
LFHHPAYRHHDIQKNSTSGLPGMSTAPYSDDAAPLDADELMNLADRVAQLPADDAEWVGRLLRECLRSRMHEAELLTDLLTNPLTNAQAGDQGLEDQLAQVALDAAEWLKTLWHVGYMGAGNFPAQPRSAFPTVELEDVLKSALFARIRHGKRPLPFPPPTRHGSPWHELVESEGETHTVDAEIINDESGQAIGAKIEGCADWRIVEETVKDNQYIVQHQGKGPLYQLKLDLFTAELRREPPRWTRRIRQQERSGFRSYTLDWPKDNGDCQSVPLRAASWERAEAEAEHWIATKYPEMVGQVSFERSE